jgi:hypothetical protein
MATSERLIGCRARSEQLVFEQKSRLMSAPSRWKEYRIRQEVYLESLKHSRLAANQASSGGTDTEVNHTSLQLLRRDKPGLRAAGQVSNRTKKHRLPGILLSSAILAGGVAIWLCWVAFAVHR